jgi:hypothetical protein
MLKHLALLVQGVTSPLAGQIVFRATLFGAFGAAKRWLSTNSDGTTRALTTLDFYKASTLPPCLAQPDGIVVEADGLVIVPQEEDQLPASRFIQALI